MADIITATALPVDSLIKVQVQAVNGNGVGAYSEVNIDVTGATIETIPAQMPAPVVDLTSSSNTQVALTWVAPTGSNKGGSNVPITTYNIYYNDALTPTTETLIGSSATSPFLVTVANMAAATPSAVLTGGQDYYFTVKAVNKYGYITPAVATHAVDAFTAQAPATPTAPTVSLSADGTYVTITWAAMTLAA